MRCYLANPDVIVREEDPDGAILFNPDTDQIRVINPTGLFIWKLCDGSKTLGDIVNSVREHFDGVPEGEVEAQIREFIERMVDGGFIGEVVK